MRFSVLALLVLLALPFSAEAARLFSSGCEFQGDTGGNMTDNLEFDRNGSAAGTTQVSTSIKRNGLSSCRVTDTGSASWAEMTQQFSGTASASTFYARFYLYVAEAPSVNAQIAVFWNGGAGGDARSSLILKTDRTLAINAANDTSELDSDATVLSLETWYRVEYAYGDTADVLIVRLDGTEIMSATPDGLSIDGFGLGMCMTSSSCGGAGDATGDWHLDDIAINDTSGSAQTSWPGSGSIVHMQPDSAGDNSGCGAGDYSSVDEVTPDDGSTICTLTTDGGGDILDVNVESSSNAGIDSYDTVSLVQVGVREAAASAASETWDLRIKSASGGTVIDGTNTSHDDTTYRTNGDVVPRNYALTSYTDPTTASAWTPTGTNSLDNMQIGITSVDASPDINVSTLWGLVEYVDGSPPAAAPASILQGFFNRGGQTIRIFGGGLRIY